MTYSSEVQADSPLGYWKLDETSGTLAADSSGNSRDGTDSAGITPGATSLLADNSGKARSFTANTSTGIVIPSASWMNVSALTLECLVNFSSAVDAVNGDAIVSRYGSGGFQWLLWRNFSGKLAFQINTSGSGFVNVADTATVSLGTPYVVTATWDGTNVKLSVGGTQVGSTGTATGSLVASTEDIRIGAYSAAAVSVPGAVIDEVSFTGTAISSGRVTTRYTAATTSTLSASGSLTLSGTAAGKAPATASGSLTLSGTATAASGSSGTTATGSLTLSGTATATAVITAGTDTTNAREGRVRTAYATVTITRPVAALPNRLTLALKVDAALAYPAPTMDKGRPT